MKILYIHQYFATHRGKTATRTLEQASAMDRAGHQITILTSASHLLSDEIPPGTGNVRRGVVGGLPCIIIDVPYHQTMGYARRIWSFIAFTLWSSWLVLREPRPDLIFATSTPLTIAIPALVGRWFRRIPYIFEVRDLWPDVPFALKTFGSRLLFLALQFLERTTYRHAVCTVGVNEDVARFMRRRGRPGQTVLVVPNACDTELFRPDRDGSWFRRQYGLEGSVLAVHTGTMGLVNGLDAILDAAGAMRDVPKLRFVILGEGKQKSALKQRVEAEKLGNVLILDGIPKAQLADVLAAADIGLMTVAPIPILELNCANKYFDYLAAGLPVVLNYGGWQADILRRHQCGLSAPMGDTPAFSQAIRQLAENTDERQAMRRNARALAEGSLSRETVVQPLLETLNQLVKRVPISKRRAVGDDLRYTYAHERGIQ